MDFNLKNKKNNSKDSEDNKADYGNILRAIDDIIDEPIKSNKDENNKQKIQDREKTNNHEYQQKTIEQQKPMTDQREKPFEIDSNNINKQNTIDQQQNYAQTSFEETKDQQEKITNEQYQKNETHNKEVSQKGKFDFSFPKIKRKKSEQISQNNIKEEIDESYIKNQNVDSNKEITSNPNDLNQQNQGFNQKVQNANKDEQTEKNKTSNIFTRMKNKSKQEQNNPSYDKSPNTNAAMNEPMGTNDQIIDNDVLKLLAITDELLGKLPEETISEFASSKDFELYKKVMTKYNILK